MSLDAAIETFYIEAHEHLEAMENILLQIEEAEPSPELLNDIFRSAHTIKGSAGIFALDHIVNFTHVVENILDKARDKSIIFDNDLLNVLFLCQDHIKTLVSTSLDDFQENQELQALSQELIKKLTPWTDTNTSDLPTEQTSEQDETNQAIQESSNDNNCWHISLRLSEDCLRNGMDPLSFIKFLETLGEIKHIETITDNFPDADNFDSETLYFAYEIALQSNAELEAIENTFMFVKDDSDITILPPDAKIDDYLALIDSLPEENQQLGDILVKCGSLTRHSLEQALNEQQQTNQEISSNNSPNSKLGEVLSQNNLVPEKVIDAALTKQKQTQTNTGKQIRIDSNRLDHLINLIGELVINQQRIDLLAGKTKSPPLIEAVDDFEDFTEQIRDAALKLRMIPIGATFQRIKRLVRDTALELNKNIELTITGSETELDRVMVEKLADPLTHIVRNAMDHGLESIEERAAANKSAKGQLTLSAYHDAGHVVISISDDGKGIDKDKVLEKAIAKGIVASDAKLSEQELFHLLFHPGFSTAQQITNLSGRGVGMDVVKRNVEALQGNIEIQSSQGLGTQFIIRLPLTLAIIDGFHVESHRTHFIIPQATIIECIDLTSHQDIDSKHCINLRGEMIPYLNICEIFNLKQTQAMSSEKQIDKKTRTELVIVQFGSDIAGIAVEKLNGEIQTVVKPLGPIFHSLKGIGGSSLLGNGEIAFILDVPQLIELAIKRDGQHNKSKNY